MSETTQTLSDIASEDAALGSVLIDPRSILEINFLKAEHFYSARNKQVFEAIKSLQENGSGIDALTVSTEIRRITGNKSSELFSYVVGLSCKVPTSEHVVYYANQVKDMAMRRELLGNASKIAQLAHDEETPINEALSQSQQSLIQIGEEMIEGGLLPVRDSALRWLDDQEKRANSDGEITGVRTGFKELDSLLWGLNEPDLVVLAARPGMGKTALALQIALNASLRDGKSIAIFNLEMSDKQMVGRAVSNLSGVPQDKIKKSRLSDADWIDIHEAIDILNKSSLHIDDSTHLTPNILRSKIVRMLSKMDIDLIIIDYISLMQSDGKHNNRVLEIGDISRELKKICKDFKIPILVLSQLSRGCESRHDKRPVMSDLRDSGEVEQNVDTAIFIYRDEYYNADTTDSENVAEIIVGKHRNGPTGTVELHWDGRYSRFSDLQRTEVYL